MKNLFIICTIVLFCTALKAQNETTFKVISSHKVGLMFNYSNNLNSNVNLTIYKGENALRIPGLNKQSKEFKKGKMITGAILLPTITALGIGIFAASTLERKNLDPNSIEDSFNDFGGAVGQAFGAIVIVGGLSVGIPLIYRSKHPKAKNLEL